MAAEMQNKSRMMGFKNKGKDQEVIIIVFCEENCFCLYEIIWAEWLVGNPNWERLLWGDTLYHPSVSLSVSLPFPCSLTHFNWNYCYLSLNFYCQIRLKLDDSMIIVVPCVNLNVFFNGKIICYRLKVFVVRFNLLSFWGSILTI